MGLIDNHDVPTRLDQLKSAFPMLGRKADSTKHKLVIHERIATRIFRLNGGTACLVKNVKPQIKSAPHFHEPLVYQGVRNEDESPLDTSRAQQAVQNQSRLDGFPQPHFIRQQDPGLPTRSHISGDEKLMGQERHAPTQKAVSGGGQDTLLREEGLVPHVEGDGVIKFIALQARRWRGEANAVMKRRLGKPVPVATVQQEAFLFDNLFDDKRWDIFPENPVANPEPNPAEGKSIASVLAKRIPGGKQNLHGSSPGFQNQAQTEFWFSGIGPSLAGNDIHVAYRPYIGWLRPYMDNQCRADPRGHASEYFHTGVAQQFA